MTLPDYNEYTQKGGNLISREEYSAYIRAAFELLSVFATKAIDSGECCAVALFAQADYMFCNGGVLGRYGIKSQKAGEVSFGYTDMSAVQLISPVATAILVKNGYYTRCVTQEA